MKKTFAVLLFVVMILSVALSGCGSSEKDALIGTWKGEFDMTSIMNDAMTAGDPEMAEYIGISKLAVVYSLTFGEDGSYSMVADRDALEAAFETMAAEIEAGLHAYVEHLLEQEGIEMSVEDFLTISNLSIDEMMAEVFNEGFVTEIVDSVSMEGNFDAKEGKVFLSDGPDTVPDPEYYETYTLEGDTLTIDQGSAQETTEFDDLIYPMVLTKVD